MKRIVILFVALFASAASMAQGAATSTAIIRLNANDCMGAKEYIDQAYDEVLKNRAEGKEMKSRIEAKFWYHRALIYNQCISRSEDPQFAPYKAMALGTAAEALEELFGVDEKGTYEKDGKMLYVQVIAGYINRAFDQIDSREYIAAKDDFERAYKLKMDPIIGEIDTTILYNAALMAQYGKDYGEAARLNRMLIDLEYQGAQTYVNLSRIYRNMEDAESAIAVVREGREKYPLDGNLLIEEVNYHIGKGDDKKAMETLNLAVEADPDNALLWNALGTIQLRLKNGEAAMNALLRAIELSDSLAEAHYSLGVIWVEKANDMVEKLNAEGVSDKEYEALKAEQIGYFESCLPYFERALELEPEDQLTLNALKMVYYKLDMTDQSMEMKKRLDALGR